MRTTLSACWVAIVNRTLGRRGAFLSLWGLLFVIYGVGLFVQPLPVQPHTAYLLHQRIPSEVEAAIWVLSGLCAIRYAFAKNPAGDAPGFIGLVAMPLIRFASYAVAYGVNVVTPYGDPRGWVSAAFYAIFVTTVVIVAGWAETDASAPAHDKGSA